jgi:serine phosphatase RsbU (regulator of sigma subunit)
MRTFSLPNDHWYPELDYNAFCQCAHEYGGNFYDFIPQDGTRLAISFGDFPSAGELHSINLPCLQALVRGLTSGSRENPAELARKLNTTLYLLGPHDLCVPWFYAFIDPVHRKLQYVNAGHEPPSLIRGNGVVERLERTGAALGFSTRAVHRQGSVALEAGDVLAVFSEALSEETVLEVVLRNPHSSAAELTRRVLEESQRTREDRSVAVVRVLGARRHPLPEGQAAENLALCAA